MGILLSDKEMESAYGGELPSYEDARRMTKAQLKKAAEELGKYTLAEDDDSGYKLIPYYVWQALLKEAGLLEK